MMTCTVMPRREEAQRPVSLMAAETLTEMQALHIH